MLLTKGARSPFSFPAAGKGRRKGGGNSAFCLSTTHMWLLTALTCAGLVVLVHKLVKTQREIATVQVKV